MEVIFDITKIDSSFFKRPVVTLGTFDGVHLGHQLIIRKVVEKAKKKKKKSVLVTYEPHPQWIIDPETAPFILTTLDEKLLFLEKLGLDLTIVVNFDKNFSKTSAEEFIKKILVEKLNIGELVVGYDHAFGKNRKGRLPLLKKKAKEYRFGLEVISPIKNDDLPIKSTKIRFELKSGDFQKAVKMLGHAYPILGKKVEGKGRGYKLGFPTINLKVPERKLLPQDGVFSAEVKIKEEFYRGMVYYGKSPTFEYKSKSLEVNIFDFEPEEDVEKVFLSLFDWIRPDIKFDNLDALKRKLKEDEKKVKRLLMRSLRSPSDISSRCRQDSSSFAHTKRKNLKGGFFANRETKKTKAC